jgi:hypothetical protein
MNTDTAKERLRLVISCLERDDVQGALSHIDVAQNTLLRGEPREIDLILNLEKRNEAMDAGAQL